MLGMLIGAEMMPDVKRADGSFGAGFTKPAVQVVPSFNAGTCMQCDTAFEPGTTIPLPD